MTTPLISATELQAMLADGLPLQIVDCSFDLARPDAGRAAFADAHLPGAFYLHLENDLSGEPSGRNGRHPLPSRQAFADRMAALGLRDDLPLVAYDSAGGMYAARLWWLWRWAGHETVRVLDGGLASWRSAGAALESGPPTAKGTGRFALRPPLEATVDYRTLRDGLGRPGAALVVDARAADRFRGENETLDPVGGHIPGAVNRPFRDNLGADGRFKPASRLQAEWQSLLADTPSTETVQQCGSGVTACHNLLALAVAGIDGSRLYPGSWSEWCAQPDAPVAVGAAG